MIVDMTRREARYLVMSKTERSARVITLVRRVTGSRDVKLRVYEKRAVARQLAAN